MHCGRTSEQLPEVTCEIACSSSSTATEQSAQFGNHARQCIRQDRSIEGHTNTATCKSNTFCCCTAACSLPAAILCATGSGCCYLLLETSCHNAKKGHPLVPLYCHCNHSSSTSSTGCNSISSSSSSSTASSHVALCSVSCRQNRMMYMFFQIILSQIPFFFFFFFLDSINLNQANVVFKVIKCLSTRLVTSLVLGFCLVLTAHRQKPDTLGLRRI